MRRRLYLRFLAYFAIFSASVMTLVNAGFIFKGLVNLFDADSFLNGQSKLMMIILLVSIFGFLFSLIGTILHKNPLLKGK